MNKLLMIVAALVMFTCNWVNAQPVSVKFVWYKVQYADTYRLQVATDSAFTSLVYDNATLTDSTMTVSSLARMSKFYWHVSASNVSGTSPWSATWDFTTAAPIPIAVILYSPLKGAVIH